MPVYPFLHSAHIYIFFLSFFFLPLFLSYFFISFLLIVFRSIFLMCFFLSSFFLSFWLSFFLLFGLSFSSTTGVCISIFISSSSTLVATCRHREQHLPPGGASGRDVHVTNHLFKSTNKQRRSSLQTIQTR